MTEPDRDPFSYTLEEFLAGPGYGENDLDIDQIFATPLHALLAENPHDDLRYDDTSQSWPCSLAPELRYVEVEAGVLLLDASNIIVGMYAWTALAVAETWQGRGLGADLVIQKVSRWGANPVWHLDAPAYSPAGRAAHESAWRTMQKKHPQAR